MGIPVLIMGESGSGKSTSLRNFPPDEIGIFNVASKPLPFRAAGMKLINHAGYGDIISVLKRNSLHCYAIDDSQYLMCFEMFARANEGGYKKYTDMALNFYSLLQSVINDTDDNTIVYFLHHVEVEDGFCRAKTVGKMLREKLTVEGLFSIVLMCTSDKLGHHFMTQSEGLSTAKSPMGTADKVVLNVQRKLELEQELSDKLSQLHERMDFIRAIPDDVMREVVLCQCVYKFSWMETAQKVSCDTRPGLSLLPGLLCSRKGRDFRPFSTSHYAAHG